MITKTRRRQRLLAHIRASNGGLHPIYPYPFGILCLIGNPPIWTSSTLYFSVLSQMMSWTTLSNAWLTFRTPYLTFSSTCMLVSINTSFLKLEIKLFSPFLKSMIHLSWFYSYLWQLFPSFIGSSPVSWSPVAITSTYSHHFMYSPQVV